MISEVLKYKEIKKNISKEISNSPFKTDYVIKQSGINYNTFYRKLRNKTFTSDEILKILFIIKPKEAHDYKFEILLKESLKEVREGNFISDEQMQKQIAQRYELDL